MQCEYVLEIICRVKNKRKRWVPVYRRYLVPYSVNEHGERHVQGSPHYLGRNERATDAAKKLGWKVTLKRFA